MIRKPEMSKMSTSTKCEIMANSNALMKRERGYKDLKKTFCSTLALESKKKDAKAVI